MLTHKYNNVINKMKSIKIKNVVNNFGLEVKILDDLRRREKIRIKKEIMKIS